jgi:hypothetical protein
MLKWLVQVPEGLRLLTSPRTPECRSPWREISER